jgi:hypothetical protein
VADQKKLSGILTQAQLDAEALYAAAAGVNPAQAELIKKNAQGNIMSPGVLQSLSSLGVDAKSGVASSIANIDASTREQRLANQKDVATKRETEAFKNSNRGQAWQALKFAARGVVTAFSAIPQFVDATYRTTLEEVKKRGVVSGITTGLGINPFISGEEQGKIAERTFEQTQYGQVVVKSIADAKKGKFPDIQMGEGFFPSEEIGVGHAARQASLSAAKIAIRNDKGELLGYRPRTLFGDTFSNVFTLGNPETVAGANIALVADIAGSFLLDPGIARGQQIKELRKLAEQQQASGAFKAAAETMDRLSKIEEVEKQAIESAKALRTQADAVKNIDVETFSKRAKDARAAATGKAEDAIKSSVSVRVAQARLDEITTQKAQLIEKATAATEARKALEQAAKAPGIVDRTQNAIIKQTKQLDQIKAEISDAVAAGRVPMYTADDLDNLQASIKALEEKLSTAKGLVPETPVTQDAIVAAKELEKKSKSFVKEATDAEKFSIKQVTERSRTQRATEALNERALREAAKAKKSERTLSEKLDDANLSLKDKRKAWEIDVQRLANVNKNLERPEFAYQAIADFLTAGHGTAAVDKLVELTDWKQIWRKADGKISHEVARSLANATTPDDIVDILSPYLLKGDIQGGVLKPGLLARRGEAISQRTKFAVPAVRTLQGVGARVQSRLIEHEKVANLFSLFNNGAEIAARSVKRGYQTKVKAGSIVNIHDREELLRATEDFGVASKLDKKVLDGIIDEIADAGSASVAGYAASVKLMKAVFAQYGEKIPTHMQDAFKSYTTAFQDSAEEMSSYWAKRHVAGDAKLEYMTLKGESVVLPGPHLSSELLNSTVYFPPVSELLRLTSKLSKIKSVSKAEEIGDALIGNFWKKLVLVRPAYVIRNIAEEQIRVAATGHISFFNNPGMALAMWLGRDDGKSWRKVLRQFDTYRHTVFDESFSTGDDALDILDETLGHQAKNSYVDMMNSANTGLDASNFKVLQFKNIGAVGFGGPRFFDGIANQLRMLNSDIFSRVVAGFDTPQIKAAVAKGQFRQDAVIDYFLHGAGRKDLDSFAESTPQKFKAFIKTPDGLKAYLYNGKSSKGEDISVLARVSETTGGNKSLMEMVAKGKTFVGGAEYRIPRADDGAVNSITNSKAMKAGKKALLEEQSKFAKQLKDTFSSAGNWDNVTVNVPSKNVVFQENKKSMFEFVDNFFDKATEFEKNTTFGPEYRQAYWDAINRVAKALDSNAKAQLLRVAGNSLNPLQRAGRSAEQAATEVLGQDSIIKMLNSQRAKGFTAESYADRLDSLVDYTNGSGNYSLVNSILRGEYKASGKEATKASKITNDLDSLISRAPKLDSAILTYRGVSGKEAVEKLLSLKAGDTFVDNTFVSTDLNVDIAKRFARQDGVIIEITNPAGTKGIFPLGFRTDVNGDLLRNGQAESEWLLPRDTTFHVTEVDGNRIKVTLNPNVSKTVGSKHPVWNAFKAADGNGPLSLEDAHAYADNYARKHVKELFYNAHEKRLIFHQLRLVAPFAAAWENTITKWAQLGMENKYEVYKAVKGLQWAQDPESSSIYLMTDAEDYYDPNQGFFFTNPESGQRQFFVPFAGTVMASLAKGVTGSNYNGAPIAFTANPMSFNFAFGSGTMLPGVGPGVTLPLSALGTFNNNIIDNMPMGIQKWLFPFGRADFSGGLQSAILPGNWNKILGFATGSENTYASNFKPVMNYLASGGNYNLDNPDDQARLVADTDTFSRWESVMRGVVGLVSPVSLIQNGLAKDKDGDTTLQVALLEDFQTIFQKNDGDYNKTWYDFLNLYGASQAFALISASAGNAPSNWDSYNFVVSNPDVASKYKDVWGYVMPGGGLSTEMYQWNIIHGTKQKLSPQQILEKVNNQRFYAARDALMTRVDAGELDKDGYRIALQTLKDSMGGGPVAEFDPNKRGRVISQLETLVQDERFVDAPSIVALRDYMALRQTALDNLGKKTFTGAKSEQAERDWLAAQAEWVIEANPDFQKMFYAFFSNELEGK